MKSNISIFKPSRSPFWYLQWRDADGRKKQKSTGCKDKPEAMKCLTDFKSFTKEKAKPVLFSAFAEQFKTANAGTLAEGTLTIYKQSFGNFIRLVGDISLNRITARQWDCFKAGRLVEVEAVTVNIGLRALRAALSTAVRWKLIEINPFSRQPLCRIADVDAAFISLEQLKRILAAVHNAEVRDCAAIAFNTGMRRAEIVSLQWSNIDFVAGVISIRNDTNFRTKTGKQRTIPMNAEVLATLSRRKQQQTDEGERVFPNVEDEFVSKQFKKATRLVLGENTPVHFHSLRHSFCSNLVRAGANIRVVQSLAGHSSIITTEKYLHNVTSDARNAVELLSLN